LSVVVFDHTPLLPGEKVGRTGTAESCQRTPVQA